MMKVSTEIEAEDVADEMRRDPKFGMDVLAYLAEKTDPFYFERDGCVPGIFHMNTASFLRKLADMIDGGQP
jgi:hypothetical protein